MADSQPWVPLEGRDLLVGLRDILVANPERHNQAAWLGNVYADPEKGGLEERTQVPVDEIRRYMFTPPPLQPADSDAEVPPCGTTGCAFGWAAILAAPPGSYITNGRVYFPDATLENVADWVAPRLGLDPLDAFVRVLRDADTGAADRRPERTDRRPGRGCPRCRPLLGGRVT